VEERVRTLGVDFGRVINDGSSHPSGDDTTFLTGSEKVMLATPEMTGAFDSLKRLTSLFGGRIWIVSKAGPRIQGNTERWLDHHDFFAATGMSSNHLRFVRRRADKAAVCQELGVTHFVDDRAEVLAALAGIVPHLYLFGPQTSPSDVNALSVLTWAETEREIAESLYEWPKNDGTEARSD
jgi:hypothetical protein